MEPDRAKRAEKRVKRAKREKTAKKGERPEGSWNLGQQILPDMIRGKLQLL
jgi:hypothetical protein